MAKRTTTLLIDDIDGSDAIETLLFGLDGTTYAIDLNQMHAGDLREVLAPFISVARRVDGPARRRRQPTSGPEQPGPGTDVDLKAVRAWAHANGVPVNARGRIKADVLKQYNAAK